MILNGNDIAGSLRELFVTFPVFLVSITLHEFSHALAADRLGDPTPRLAGRLSLNPLAHLDLLGTLMLLIAPFGWAKPVPIDPRNLKGRFDQLVVSAAGPLANFLLAVLGLLILKHAPYFQASLPQDRLGDWVLLNMELLGAIPLAVPLLVLVLINIVLMLFNLLPIPPLDGFGILADLLPEKWRHGYYDLLPYGIILLVLFMVVPTARHAFNLLIVTVIQGMVAFVP